MGTPHHTLSKQFHLPELKILAFEVKQNNTEATIGSVRSTVGCVCVYVPHPGVFGATRALRV